MRARNFDLGNFATRTLGPALLALPILGFTGCHHDLSDPAALEETEHDAAQFVSQGDALFEQLTVEGDYLVTPVITAEHLFNRVFAMFDARTPVLMEARGFTDGEPGPWQELDLVFSEEDAHSARIDVAGNDGVQLRFIASVEAGLRFMDVRAFNAVVIDEIAQGDLTAQLGETVDRAPLARDNTDVVSRAGWGARAARCGSARHTPNRITVHHTETPNDPNVSPSTRMRQIQNFHQDGRGWCDVGYHLLIGHDGQIYQGREEDRRGAHAGSGNNTNNVGISFIGAHQNVLPTAAALEAGARAIRTVAAEWNISLDRSHVFGHREMRSTDCPGQTLFNFLPDLVEMARSGQGAPNPPPTMEPGCSSSTLGHQVSSGECVQVQYPGCGVDSCAWFGCVAGSWTCTAVSSCGGETHRHATCEAPTEPGGDDEIMSITNFPATFSRDTRTSTRDEFDNYSCAPGTNESGPEHLYEVVVEQDGFLLAEVDDSGNVDVDVHLLSAQSSDACLDRDDERIRVRVSPGTYVLAIDTYVTSAGTQRDGAYTLRVDFEPLPASSGACTVVDTELEMFWSSCADSVENCSRTGGRSYLQLPATGPVVKEAHLVTTSESFSGGWPSSSNHDIDDHYALSASVSGYAMNRTESWAPAGEGGSQYGQGSTGSPIPVVDEAFYITMYWRQRPVGGTRMIVTNPANGRSVVASAGWETGPGSNAAIAGVSEEIHNHLGTGHLSTLTVAFAADPNLPLGPIECGASAPPAPEPEPDQPAGSYADVTTSMASFEAIEALRDIGALWGCGPGMFCPDAPLKRDALANMLAVLEPGGSSSSTQLFNDVNSTHWAYDAVQKIGSLQITYGCGGGDYCPGMDVSRASYAVYVRRAFDLSSVSPSTFSDVSSAHWAGASIEAAARASLIEGCGPSLYCPSDTITRAEAALWMARAYDLIP